MAENIYKKLHGLVQAAGFKKEGKMNYDSRGGGKVNYDYWKEETVSKLMIERAETFGLLFLRTGINVHFSDARNTACTVEMTCINVDAPDERVQFMGMGAGNDSSDKHAGMASTYAVKDAYLKLAMAVSGMDTDNVASLQSLDQAIEKAKTVLDGLWASGYYSGKARTALGEGADAASIGTKATEIYKAALKRVRGQSKSDVEKTIGILKQKLSEIEM